MIRDERHDGIALLRLEHGKVNALDAELMAALGEALDRAEADGARALVLTGSGSSFSAGVDLKRVLDGGAAYIESFVPRIGEAVRRLMSFPRPTVAALNGHAIAGGFVLACACDRRLAARGTAKLGLTELPIGVPFPWFALEAVRAAAGTRQAAEIVYGGRLMSVEECVERGLVEEAVEPEALERRAVELAAERAAIPAPAYALAKRQLIEPILARAGAEAANHDAEVLANWRSDATLGAIRSYMESLAARR